MPNRAAKGLAVALAVVMAVAAGCAAPPEREAHEAAARLEQRYLQRRPAAAPAESGLPALTDESDLADCLAYAALNNPGLEAAFYRWKAALERVPQVRALPDPRFNYRYYIREVETRVGPQRQSFGVSQTFPWLGKLDAGAGVALAAAEAERQRYETERLRLFYRVKDAWYEYYYLSRAIENVRENRDLMKYLEGVARARLAAAAGEQASLLRAQVELGKLDDRLRTLQDLAPALAARLNAALGRAPGLPVPRPKTARCEPIAASDDEVLAWLREASPHLQALQHEIDQAERGVDLARQDYYPDVTLGLDAIQTDEAAMAGMRDSGKDPVMAMVSVSIPIWFGKYEAGVREARSRHWAALREKAETENALGAEVKMALYRLRDAARRIDLYRDTLVPKARQALETTEAAFRAGAAPFADLVDAQRVLLEFQLAHERALADHAIRLAETEMLVGRAIPRAAGEAVPPGAAEKGEPLEGGEP